MLKLVLLLSAFVCVCCGVCRIYMNSNVTQNHAPLLLRPRGSSYSLLKPSGSNFHWREGEGATIGCADVKNIITKTNHPLSNITCSRNQEFRLGGEEIQFNQLSCSSDVTGSIKAQNRSCAGGLGKFYDIGFQIKKVPFIKYFEVCYNERTSSVIYTEHEILGNSIDVAQISNTRPSFKTGGLKGMVRFSSVYTQNSQKDRLAELLGSETEAAKYISTSSFFAKGHLTPDGDAVLDTWAGATYFYINVAPEWQVINVGNWVRVENFARKIAGSLNSTMQIYTGVYDILKLPDTNGQMVPITLAENSQLEAPRWYWKIVHHAASNSAIAFVTLNNPFARKGEHLCTDICDRYGWSHKEFQDLRKGFTYCCTVRELRKVIKFIPTKADAANILRFN